MRNTFLFFILFSSNSFAVEFLETVDSDVFQTTGSVQEITQKAKTCMARIGATVVDSDIDGGKIIAHGRIDYTSLLLEHNVRSIVSFHAKEGKFKIGHTNIEYLQKSTGNFVNIGYMKVVKAWGTGWRNAEEALQNVTTQIASCVLLPSKNDEW